MATFGSRIRGLFGSNPAGTSPSGTVAVPYLTPAIAPISQFPADRDMPLDTAKAGSYIIRELGATATAPTLIEYVPELVNPFMEISKYEEMIMADAQVRVVLWAVKLPILSGQWYVEPADGSQTCIDHAEFVKDNMHRMIYPWEEFLLESLRCLDFGYSIFEKVFELRQWTPPSAEKLAHRKPQQRYMWKKLAPRPAVTCLRFIYDENGGPEAIEHNVPDANAITALATVNTVEIPINKTIVFTWDKRGGNMRGMSILRSAYKHWFYKDKFYLLDAIQKERHSTGIPYAAIPPGASTTDILNAKNMLSNIRTNANAYFMKPPGWEMGFEEVHSNLVNSLQSAEHHDLMIARNVLAQFINIGASAAGGTGGGSRASGATMADLFQKSCKAIAEWHVQNVNRYLVKQLIDINFGPQDDYPEMKVRGVADGKDFQVIASALANLQKGGFVTADEATEQFWRNELDMPRKIVPRPDGADFPQSATNLDVGQLDANNVGLNSGTGANGTGNIPKGPREGGEPNGPMDE